MKPLSTEHRQSLEVAVSAYEQQLRGAQWAHEYLRGRGFTGATAQRFRIGAVVEPLPGHERFAGMLVIPNICAAGHPVGIKMRRLDNGTPKYDGPAGQKHRIWNARALTEPGTLVICEGEWDAMSCAQAGFGAVSVPAGSNSWKPHYSRLMLGRDVVVAVDNDEAGDVLREKILDAVPHGRGVVSHQVKDCNEALVKLGTDGLREMLL